MINLIPTKTDDLRVLLERLYPDTRISDTGVALLAAEITDLENRREAMQSRIDFDAQQVGLQSYKVKNATSLHRIRVAIK
jgi:hypothetical protein